MGRDKKTRGLAAAIRERVAELGTSLEQGSVDLGLPKNQLSRWTRGAEPLPANYEVLMDFLGVSLDELGALIVRDQLTRSGLPRL